jgi:hypothetical protein
VAAAASDMKKSWLLNAVMLILVVALGWFFYYKPRSDEPTTYALSTLKADQVRHLRLERGVSPAVAIEKQDDLWLITAPFTAHADPFHIERLLAIVAARAAHRYAGTDLTRFELDQPQARLTIDGQSFTFGIVSAMTREQYVLTGGTVYAIDPRYGRALPATAEDLIRMQLFAADEAPARFEFEDFSVVQSEGKWSVAPPVADLSQDDFNRWVDEWRQATALRAERLADKRPVGEIKVEFKGGKKLAIGILQREPDLVISRPDEQVQYYFPSQTAKRLLAPPGQRSQ